MREGRHGMIAQLRFCILWVGCVADEVGCCVITVGVVLGEYLGGDGGDGSIARDSLEELSTRARGTREGPTNRRIMRGSESVEVVAATGMGVRDRNGYRHDGDPVAVGGVSCAMLSGVGRRSWG